MSPNIKAIVGLEGGGFFSFPSDTYLHDIEVVEGVNTGSVALNTSQAGKWVVKMIVTFKMTTRAHLFNANRSLGLAAVKHYIKRPDVRLWFNKHRPKILQNALPRLLAFPLPIYRYFCTPNAPSVKIHTDI